MEDDMNETKARPAVTGAELLERIAKDEGTTVDAVLEAATYDSVCPGICVACAGTVTETEPDQRRGWCDECHRPTVRSALVIAGLL
jgi:hypothetical protein